MCSWGAAIAAVISLYAANESAQAQKESGKANQAIAEQNKKIADFNAQDAMNRGNAEAEEKRMKTRLLLGQQRAAIAANNVELSTGTSLDVLGDTALFGAIDEQRIRDNARRQAWGYSVEGQNYRWQGQLERWRGQTGARTTYLNAASNIAGMYAGGGGGGG